MADDLRSAINQPYESDVATVRAIYAAIAALDLEQLPQLLDEDVVITEDPALPWGGRFEGHDGFLLFAAALTGTITSQVEISSIFAADGDVFQVGRTVGTVNETGVEFDIAEVHRWTMADGKAVRAHFAIDTPAMLSALGESAGGQSREHHDDQRRPRERPGDEP